MEIPKPIVLVILDGWGYREEKSHNAIASAKTPQWDTWWSKYPHTLLDASGEQVGLPMHQMGNSEVGHMHIGAGRIIPQDFTRINEAITHHLFKRSDVLCNLISEAKNSSKKIHVMGLLSDGGVHSHENHLFEFLTLCHELNFNNVSLHLFLDGRDVPPQSAELSLTKLHEHLIKHPVGKVHSLSGRYYAMDRDKRWERTATVYQLLTEGISSFHFETPVEALQFYYKKNILDEFFPPTVIGTPSLIEPGDSIFFFNFRADRARQLTQAFVDEHFDGFIRNKHPKFNHFVTMTNYGKKIQTDVVFPQLSLKNTLGEVLSKAGLTQLRVAETEKYAHVTFFLNGGCEKIFEGEERILIPSPHVATYDLMPNMSAEEMTQVLLKAIKSEAYDVIICNFANADMVGHTGNFEACVQAIECLDQCLQQLGQAIFETKGALLITADHGNAEAMYDEVSKQAHTAHTCEPVPFIYIGEENYRSTQTRGNLIDIAPTILSLLEIEIPKEMTGKILLVKSNE